ncbi:hypothetical protein ACIBJF_46460 [Streptomyces sp. NPDC050743]|uniref:hypothetical protein n=1 Tax=Streptomyces sp. NPDC050743 TaxID=3365634 RepID=UPI003795D153
MEAWGAQMELRAIQRRNRNATQKMRAAGRPKGKPSYGFQYVRTVMGGKIDHVALHPQASTVIRTVARRILADPENVTTSSEAARLNRAGEHPEAEQECAGQGAGPTGAVVGPELRLGPVEWARPCEVVVKATRTRESLSGHESVDPAPSQVYMASELGFSAT